MRPVTLKVLPPDQPAVSASLGNLLELEVLQPHLSHSELEYPGLRTSNFCLNKPFSDPYECSSLTTTAVDNY